MKKTLYLNPIFTLFVAAMLNAQTDISVLLHTGTTVFLENTKDYAKNAYISNKETIEGNYYRLIQFHKLPGKLELKALKQQGIQLLEYIPNTTYVASIPTGFDVAKFEALGVRSIQPISGDLKMAAPLKNASLPDWTVSKNKALLMLKFFKNIKHEHVLNYCKQDGIEVLRSNGHNNFLKVSVPLEKIKDLTALPYVAFIEPVPAPSVPDDILGRSLHRSNLIDSPNPSGRHYTGEGVGVLVRDDGDVGPHIDFTGRIDNSNAAPVGGTHGDGVAGIMAGAGNLDPWNRGMAAGASVWVVDYEAEFLDETMDLHLNNGVLVTNSSYSNGCNDGYTEITETVDQQLNSNPTLIHVFSAGNANPSDCGYGAGNQWGNITGGHKQAKNCLTTANLNSNGTLNSTSSRGPAHDGRIKPDIAAHGAEQISTDEENTYQVFGGTSAASPGIAGITAQLHQAYRELNNGQVADAALLKAILLTTANDLGNEGPDFRFGWGHVNAYRAALALEENRFLKAAVDPGDTVVHDVAIPANIRQARLMVYWRDPEATAFTTKALVNDLDIWVEAPNGTVFRPWLLNHTPNATTLNDPATTGEDHLNNMEQVALTDPQAGNYKLKVKGTVLPFGAHDYYFVWELRTRDITITHPAGGESFAPGETVRIHWDAQGNTGGAFTVWYSKDGGANYTSMASPGAAERLYDWVVPADITEQAKIKVTRSVFTGETAVPFSIAPRPTNVRVDVACPNYLRLTWDPVTISPTEPTIYEVYLLGAKYMESVGTTTDNWFDVPTINQNPTNEHWMAVRAKGSSGVVSERTIAIRYGEGMYNCILNNDAALNAIISPSGGSVFGCGSFEAPVVVSVTNNSTQEQPFMNVSYSFNGGTPVEETIPGPIAAGATFDYTFSTLLVASGSGDYTLDVTCTIPNDEAVFNNHQSLSMSLSIYPNEGEPLNYSQNFQGGIFPPTYYSISNPDGAITWDQATITGSNGATTVAAYMDNYSYDTDGEEDEMLVVPIDISGATNPVLTFDVAYARYNNEWQDGLRVELSTDCGATFNQVIYDKFGTVLATVPDMTGTFSPTAANQWRNEQINLTPYIGNSIVLKFININGFGNQLYVDNINVIEFQPPVAQFTASAETVCQGETVVFTNNSSGPNLTYLWTFGTGASPATSTQAGPITVTFNQPGNFTPALTVTNAAGQSSASSNLTVNPDPVASFTFEQNLGEITLTNTSQYGDSYFWDYGDGGGSFTGDAIHTHSYTADGDYTVSLTVTNACGSKTYTQTVTIDLTAVNELEHRLFAAISPNPNPGIFNLTVHSDRQEGVDLALSDVRGVVHQSSSMTLTNGAAFKRFEAGHLAPGLYFLKIRNADGFIALKVLVQ
jgi:PKD repeat protein